MTSPNSIIPLFRHVLVRTWDGGMDDHSHGHRLQFGVQRLPQLAYIKRSSTALVPHDCLPCFLELVVPVV